MVFTGVGHPLLERDVPRPEAGPGSVRLDVHACGVCRTDLHILDGELPGPTLPLVLGHQIVGTVAALGDGAKRFAVGAAGRRSLARLDLRAVPLLPRRPREPLRRGALHGLRRRRRLRGGNGRGRALLLSDSRRLPGRPGRAAALRRPDRLSRVFVGGRRGAARAVRIRRGRAHRLPGRACRGAARLRVHAPG